MDLTKNYGYLEAKIVIISNLSSKVTRISRKKNGSTLLVASPPLFFRSLRVDTWLAKSAII